MARVVSVKSNQIISLNVVTKFEDGTSSTKVIKVGDVVENLRYIEDGEVKTVSGNVDSFTYGTINTSVVKYNSNAKNTFGRDVKVFAIVVDASELYDSKVVTVPVNEIVEDEGLENVVKVDSFTSPELNITVTRSDDSEDTVSLVPGDLVDATIMNPVRGGDDYVGRYVVQAFSYKAENNAPHITGIAFKDIETNKVVKAGMDYIKNIHEIPTAQISDFSEISSFLSEAFATNDEVAISLTSDVSVPERTDGRITTTMINAGKKLTVDLAGHNFTTKAYAFYVNGGDLVISDSTGSGEIKVGMPKVAYPVIQVSSGTCTMLGGNIDCTNVELAEGEYNWMYGVVCANDGIFNMTGGSIHTDEASAISICNGTATGAGSQFIIGGNAKLISDEGPAVYNADQKIVVIQDDAVVKGGILARLGTIIVKDNAEVMDYRVSGTVDDLGAFLPLSGSMSFYGYGPIVMMSGCYTSNTDDNSIGVEVLGNATLTSDKGDGIVLIPLDTKQDQTVDVVIEDSANFNVAKSNVKVYTHEELMELAEAAGTASRVNITKQSTITVNGEVIFPIENNS